jgi:PAS domain S-box-containing protein
LFESAPGLFLVLAPDAPRYTILAVSDAYLRATARTREALVGAGLLGAWPPDVEPTSTSFEGVIASLARVIATRTSDTMAVEQHAVAPFQGPPEARFWSRSSSPILSADGALRYIIHRVEDVTAHVLAERRRREEPLAASEARYRELFESAPEGIFVATPEGVYTDVNAAGCRLLGYTREELIGRSITELVAPDALPRQTALTRHILAGGAEVSEWELRCKDGTFVPVELSVNTLPDGHLRAFVRDITKRHTAEDALRLSEAKYSGIVSISADAILSVDESQRITLVNDAAERMFGYAKGELLGAPLDLLIPERLRLAHHGHITRFAEGQGGDSARRMGTRGARILGRRKDGEEFVADAAISRLDLGGKRVLSVAVRDFSEQERAESEERFLADIGGVLVGAGSDHRRLLAEIADVIVRDIADWCVVDLVEHGEVRRLKVVHADPAKAEACADMMRREVHQAPNVVTEAVGKQRPILVNEVTDEYLRTVVSSDEQEAEAHLRVLRAFEPKAFIVAPLVARSVTLGTLTFGTSRATRRLGLADVRQAERLASRVALAVDNARAHEAVAHAVRARDEVLGIVAHDLRNPLNSIVLQTQTLRRRRGGPERRDQRSADAIHRAAMRMNHLIQDLLDVTRLEAGERLAIRQDATATAAILAEVIAEQREAMPDYDRTFEVVVAGDLPAVWADRARLHQILENLLGNALKFSRSKVTIGAKAERAAVLFWVADDGPGIEADALPHVFDRFWQATGAGHEGVGLGLSIVKSLVEAQGGRVWVESTAGAGATFLFTLPLAP